jgi:hypothetical protein
MSLWHTQVPSLVTALTFVLLFAGKITTPHFDDLFNGELHSFVQGCRTIFFSLGLSAYTVNPIARR